ncbi:Transposase [Klebsiella variicola]|nr:hypothetical protein SB5387_02580 [Klebsiella variicola]
MFINLHYVIYFPHYFLLPLTPIQLRGRNNYEYNLS